MSGFEYDRRTFCCRLHQAGPEVGIEREDGSLRRSNGADRVEFLIAPNPGEGLKPLVKIASGGETSRLMLALKNVLALPNTSRP